jgi:hypothetical protein
MELLHPKIRREFTEMIALTLNDYKFGAQFCESRRAQTSSLSLSNGS